MKELKQQLIAIRENGYDFSGYDLDELSLRMMKYIGTTDGKLRDELIYTTFGYMIVEKELLDSNQLNKLLRLSIDDQHLFFGLGEFETDSVFARAFSVLVLGLILGADYRHLFLSEKEYIFLKERILIYVENERDVRGFVEGKGWAHAVAHAADTLGELIKHPYSTDKDYEGVLKVIKSRVLYSDSVYSHNEDERIALPALYIINEGSLKEKQIIHWIEDFESRLNAKIKQLSDAPGLNIRMNVRNFLRSLYFRLRLDNSDTHLQTRIEKVLDAIREF